MGKPSDQRRHYERENERNRIIAQLQLGSDAHGMTLPTLRVLDRLNKRLTELEQKIHGGD